MTCSAAEQVNTSGSGPVRERSRVVWLLTLAFLTVTVSKG